MHNDFDNFWDGFGHQSEKTAFAVPLARFVGKLSGKVSAGASAIRTGAKSLPGRVGAAFQEGSALGKGNASLISSGPKKAIPAVVAKQPAAVVAKQPSPKQQAHAERLDARAAGNGAKPATAKPATAKFQSKDEPKPKPLTGFRRRGADILTGGLVAGTGVHMMSGGQDQNQGQNQY